jgi:GNAT superfamily N-acetyltransferase
LGALPSPHRVKLVPSARRTAAGWDGHVHPFVGVAAGEPFGNAVLLSVARRRFQAVHTVVAALNDAGSSVGRTRLQQLPSVLGVPERRYGEAALRWSSDPRDSPDVGHWYAADEPFLPPWLRPFGGPALVACDARGRCLAGVGIKRHDRLGHELAVHTAAEARGRGLARSLVTQAARRVIAEGAMPLYLHNDDNHASARVAEGAGFPDNGWTWLGLSDPTYA